MTKANRTKLKRKYDRNYFVLRRNGGNRRSQIPDKSAFVTIFESKILRLATMLAINVIYSRDRSILGNKGPLFWREMGYRKIQ